jgi:hypothetical protein
MGYLYAREENYDEAPEMSRQSEKWQSARLPAVILHLEATNGKLSRSLEESIEWV